jgi:hypothetical protein
MTADFSEEELKDLCLKMREIVINFLGFDIKVPSSPPKPQR